MKQISSPTDTLRWIDHHGGLPTSQPTEQELLAVLRRRRIAARLTRAFADNVRRLLAAAEHVTITEHLTICRDPTDDMVPELAFNGRADLIVSGDADLLALDTVRGIPSVTPAAFTHVHML